MPCKYFYLLVPAIALMSCSSKNHNEEGVKLAVRQYDSLIRRTDAKGIAQLYAPDGNLGDKAHGRAAIQHFLEGFKNFKVLYQHSSSEVIKIKSDTAWQRGSYRQRVVLPSKDTVTVKGDYKITWLWVENGWHIKNIDTQPKQ